MFKVAVFIFITCTLSAVSGLPQLDVRTSNVQEVQDPELKRKIFEDFNQGGKSILYKSLFPELQEGDVVGELVIDVESPALKLTKPKNPERKLKEQADSKRSGRND